MASVANADFNLRPDPAVLIRRVFKDGAIDHFARAPEMVNIVGCFSGDLQPEGVGVVVGCAYGTDFENIARVIEGRIVALAAALNKFFPLVFLREGFETWLQTVCSAAIALISQASKGVMMSEDRATFYKRCVADLRPGVAGVGGCDLEKLVEWVNKRDPPVTKLFLDSAEVQYCVSELASFQLKDLFVKETMHHRVSVADWDKFISRLGTHANHIGSLHSDAIVVAFVDELNAAESVIGAATEVFVDHSWKGSKLPKNLVFVAAINPASSAEPSSAIDFTGTLVWTHRVYSFCFALCNFDNVSVPY